MFGHYQPSLVITRPFPDGLIEPVDAEAAEASLPQAGPQSC